MKILKLTEKNLNILRISVVFARCFIYILKKLNARIYHRSENYSFDLKKTQCKVLILFIATFAVYIVRQNTQCTLLSKCRHSNVKGVDNLHGVITAK